MQTFSRWKGNRRRSAESVRRPKLIRKNAVKNIDYDVSGASSPSDESTSWQFTRSLDLSPVGYPLEGSFRVEGSVDGLEHLYQTLGLSGPDDFGIPADAWAESVKVRSSRFFKSDSLPEKLDNSSLASILPAESSAEAVVLSEEIGVRSRRADEAAFLQDIRVEDKESEEILQSFAGKNERNLVGSRVAHMPVVAACQPPASVICSSSGRLVLEQQTSITYPIDEMFTSRERASSAVLSDEARFPRPVEIPLLQELHVIDNEPAEISQSFLSRRSHSDGGIKGTRPPVLTPPPPSPVLSSAPMRSVLAPPPSMSLPIQDKVSSPWDIVRSFAPEDGDQDGDKKISSDSEVEDEEEVVVEEEKWVENEAGEESERAVMLVETTDGTGSFSTTNDDDSSSTTTDHVPSPNGHFKKHIKSWMRGQLLGSGSFGTVYEGISDDGTFIAIKEVSLLDKGSNAKQCILQLEHEIELLSQFEHENIVQYYGTDKEESKLVIFLELVTQGSLASLYQKYHLRDTQVSAYTRQILSGLNYLHERNVVHRDIKCANILVHANGSVKLADFGLAKEISKFSDLKSCKGSVYWMAPEVVHPKKTYGRAADIWSLGCTVLELLTRQIPFPNVEWQHAFFKLGRGDQPPIPDHLSREAQDFIRKCVQVDPSSRPTAAQLLEHPFVKRRPVETFSF